MSKSRSRLAADYFAKLRINAASGAIEHEEINSQLSTLQAEVSAIEGMATSDWQVQQVDSNLNFRYNDVTKALLNPNGEWIVDGQVFAFGLSLTELTLNTDQTNLNLHSWALANGWTGLSELIVTVAPGIYISSNSTGVPGLVINGSFPGGVTLINNGYIVGMGGAGGVGSNGAGAAGGTALLVQSASSVNNVGTIAGGGGGGGAGANGNGGQGGGGGGGRTGRTNSAGGARAGGAGTAAGAGAGGPSVYYTQRVMTWGGDEYNAPQYRTDVYTAGGGASGGNWGANGTGAGGAGGAGGLAVSGSNLITWQNLGTRNGGVV